MHIGKPTMPNSRIVMTNVDSLEPMCEDVPIDDDENDDDLAAIQEEFYVTIERNDGGMEEEVNDQLIAQEHMCSSLNVHVVENNDAEQWG